MRGRRPKPTVLKIMDGNPGKRALPDREPTPPCEVPSCPNWLSKDAKAEWRRVIPLMQQIGILTKIDRGAIAGYCQAFAEVQIATRTLDKEGRYLREPIVDKEGEQIGEKIKPHPAISAQNNAMMRLRNFLVEFGLSPSSRPRIKSNSIGEDADPMEAFLAGGKRAKA